MVVDILEKFVFYKELVKMKWFIWCIKGGGCECCEIGVYDVFVFCYNSVVNIVFYNNYIFCRFWYFYIFILYISFDVDDLFFWVVFWCCINGCLDGFIFFGVVFGYNGIYDC